MRGTDVNSILEIVSETDLDEIQTELNTDILPSDLRHSKIFNKMEEMKSRASKLEV